jgi:hypothetical protein
MGKQKNGTLRVAALCTTCYNSGIHGVYFRKRQYFTKIYDIFKCIESAIVSTENMDPAFYVSMDQDLF